MAFEPAFEETDPLAARVFRNPKKHLVDLLRGMARGTAAAPGDILDMLGQSVPGGQSAGLGDLSRALLDEVEATKATGAPLEGVGEIASPTPPMGKAAMLGSILVSGKRAVNAGMAHPQKLIDALNMWKQGRKHPEIMGQTGMYVSNPRALRNDPIIQALIETPGADIGKKSGVLDTATLQQRMKAGDLQGFDDVLKLYPELLGTTLNKIDNPMTNDLGSFSPHRNTITVNYGQTSNVDPTGVFGHELGHGIQNADKTVQGGSPEYVASRLGRFAPALQHRIDTLETAALARQLADRSGATARPKIGGAGVRDVENAWNANRASTKGSPPLTDETAIMASVRPVEDIEATLAKLYALNSKLPSNSADGYLKLGGETWSRIIENLLRKSVRETQAIGDIHKLDPYGVKADEMFDLDELTLRAIQGVGAYKPFR